MLTTEFEVNDHKHWKNPVLIDSNFYNLWDFITINLNFGLIILISFNFAS